MKQKNRKKKSKRQVPGYRSARRERERERARAEKAVSIWLGFCKSEPRWNLFPRPSSSQNIKIDLDPKPMIIIWTAKGVGSWKDMFESKEQSFVQKSRRLDTWIYISSTIFTFAKCRVVVQGSVSTVPTVKLSYTYMKCGPMDPRGGHAHITMRASKPMLEPKVKPRYAQPGSDFHVGRDMEFRLGLTQIGFSCRTTGYTTSF